MLELFERLHKKAGTKCERYCNGQDKENTWVRDISGQKCYVIHDKLADKPFTMNIYLPDGCYRPKVRYEDED